MSNCGFSCGFSDLSLSLIVEKKVFRHSEIMCGSVVDFSFTVSSSGSLFSFDLPFMSFICFHKYVLSLFSANDFAKKKKLSLQHALAVWFYFANVCTEANFVTYDTYLSVY